MSAEGTLMELLSCAAGIAAGAFLCAAPVLLERREKGEA
jgi:hypothetical protein